jgi:photosystem II stability/assembly factor-like uncharacterized protein
MFICQRILIAAVLILLSQNEIPAQPASENYIFKNVAIGGGGFVTGILFHPRAKNLIYARTDVGGAYRSDDSGKHWTPITDWIQGVDFTGIESFAIDLNDTNRIYLAAGIYSRTRAAILSSDDQGRTWQTTEVPFKMGGNESGRFNGERLAVDPNESEILFFGSRHDGLWKSPDRGATWSKLENFPQINTTETPPITTRTNATRRFRFNFMPQQIGIVFVQFVGRSPGKPTPTIYAGVSTTKTNFFRSDDGGTNWSPIPNQPLGLRPNHAAFSPDGTIYLTYGREPGPNSMTDGAVWKFNPQTGVWTEITPLKSPDGNQPFGYGAIAVDAAHPDTIVTTTFAHWRPHDEIFRSTNGGASWSPLLQNAKWDYSSTPYTKNRVPHWMGSVQIDPFDSNHVLFTTGYGIWSCNNLTDADSGKSTQWKFSDDGLEETVPLSLVSPPTGAHLLSGLGDIDGFCHDDLDNPTPQGTFASVHFSNTEDLAFAGKNPSIIVRTGTGRNEIHAAISVDGGKNWSTLGSEPPDSFGGGGTIAISADGEIIVWTLRRNAPNFSADLGENWTNCAGLAPELRVIADAVNPSRFYAFDSRAGKFFASTNGAENFSETGAELPAENISGNFGFGGGATLSAAPEREGDLWLTFGTNGLYHSENGGVSFVKLENAPEAYSLGFGKAVSGKNFLALYLAGKIGSIEGLFRSVDAGATWTRINDDQHQYGWISRVTGDPRIFGRVYFATSGRGVIYGDELK